MTPRPCPACGGTREAELVEQSRDAVSGVLYRLHRCGSCGVVFAEPRDPVAAPAAPSPAGAAVLDRVGTPGKLLILGTAPILAAAARGRGGAVVEAPGGDLEAFLKSRSAKEFDAVVLAGALESSPEPRGLLEGLKSVIKRGGLLTVTLPNAARPSLFPRSDEDRPPRVFTRWDARALRALLESEDFSVLSAETPGPSVRWLCDELFRGWLAPAAEAAARRALFGPDASGTLDQLYAGGAAEASRAAPDGLKGFLADAERRRRLADFTRSAFRAVAWPAGLLLAAFYRLRRRDSGERLYALARYDA